MRQIRFGDSNARVGDFKHRVAPGLGKRNGDRSAVRRVFDGVFDDVIADLRQLAGVGEHLAFVLNVNDNLLTALFRQRAETRGSLAHRVG